LKLNLDSVKKGEWDGTDIHVPGYNISSMRERTLRSPLWLHFGAGNLFRAYVARLQQSLLVMG
jgi:fructuronate reductase